MLAGEFDPSGEVDQAVLAEELAVGVAGLDNATEYSSSRSSARAVRARL
jgi:hypothetical protein